VIAKLFDYITFLVVRVPVLVFQYGADLLVSSPSVNYAQPEDKSSMNSKNETFLVPHSALQDHLLAIYVSQNLYRPTEYA